MLSRGGEVDEERASGMASGGGVAGEGSGPGILRCVSESVLILLGIWQETDTTVFMCESVVGVRVIDQLGVDVCPAVVQSKTRVRILRE